MVEVAANLTALVVVAAAAAAEESVVSVVSVVSGLSVATAVRAVSVVLVFAEAGVHQTDLNRAVVVAGIRRAGFPMPRRRPVVRRRRGWPGRRTGGGVPWSGRGP